LQGEGRPSRKKRLAPTQRGGRGRSAIAETCRRENHAEFQKRFKTRNPKEGSRAERKNGAFWVTFKGEKKVEEIFARKARPKGVKKGTWQPQRGTIGASSNQQ